MKRLAFSFEIKSVNEEERLICGFASTTHIDEGNDIVESDAAKFSEPKNVMAFVGHDYKALPVGIPEKIEQKAEGLYTETRISRSTAGNDLLIVTKERLAAGAPMGLSIGYPTDTLKASFERKDGKIVRHITSYELKEYSFTPIPMNEHAIVTAVKANGGEQKSQYSHSGIYGPAGEQVLADHIDTMATADPHELHDHLVGVNHMVDSRDVEHDLVDEGDDAQNEERHALEHGYVNDNDESDEDKAKRLAYAVKAGRVLADKNVAIVQKIHDDAHSLADNAGHDLHGHGQVEHDHVAGDNVKSKEEVATGLDPTMRVQLLDIEIAELAILK